MLVSGDLPPLPKINYGAANRPALLQAPLPMVRPSKAPDNRPRPPFYIPLQLSASQGARHLLEPVNGVSPLN